MRCPHCGGPADVADGQDPASRPGHGSVGVCAYCSGIQIFEQSRLGLFLRAPTPAELAELEADPKVKRVRAALAESYTWREALDLYRR